MARSIELRGRHVTCALIGMSRKLAAYNYASSLALQQRLSASWWVQTEVSKRSKYYFVPRTIYFEVRCPPDTCKTPPGHFISKQDAPDTFLRSMTPPDTFLRSKQSPHKGGQSTAREDSLLRSKVSTGGEVLRSKVSRGDLLRSKVSGGDVLRGASYFLTGLRRLFPHRSDCCRALMFTCRNSPLWQPCERCNNVLSSF